MPDQTLVSMTSASSLTGNELLYTVQGGGDAKVTAHQISSLALGLITGDATVSGNVLTIGSQAVSYGKIQNVSPSKLLGRGSALGAGPPEEITLGIGLTMGGTTLNSATLPGGSSANLQYNNGTAFGGTAGWRYQDTDFIDAFGLHSSGQLSGGSSTFWVMHAAYQPRLQVDQNGNDGTDNWVNVHLSANRDNVSGVYILATKSGSSVSADKFSQIGANETVFTLDVLAPLEESSGFWSWDGVGAMAFMVDGTPSSGPNASLPSRFGISINSGMEGYNNRLELRADGTNSFRSLITPAAVQDTAIPVMVLQKETYGTPAVGTGVALRFNVQCSSGFQQQNLQTGFEIDVVASNLSSAAGSFNALFKNRVSGVLEEKMRIDNLGVVSLNGPSVTGFAAGTRTPQLQAQAAGADACIGVVRWNNGTFPSRLDLAHSRGTVTSSYVIVQSGDSLGEVTFQGADGTDFKLAALIRGAVDTTPGANDMPGRLEFATTPDGDVTPAERVRINNTGNMIIGNANSTASSTGLFGYMSIGGVTVAALPLSSTVRGAHATVVDSTTTTFFTEIAGGGSIVVPVFSDGSTAWRVG